MTETATAEAPAQELTFADPLQEQMFNMLKANILKRNSLVGKANAAHGDRQTLTEQIRESDTDPEIVSAREAWSQAYENLMALVGPKVEAIIADAAGSVEGIENEIKEIDKVLKPGLNYYGKLYDDATAEAFPKQDRLKGASLGRTGAGGRRIRGFNVVVTVDGEDREFENFTQAAKHLDVDTTELQKAFFAAAGTDDLKAIADNVKFIVNFTEVDSDGAEQEKDASVRAYRTEPTAQASDTAESTNEVDEDSDEDSEDADPFEDE